MAYTTSQAVEALNEYMGCDEALKQYIEGTKERGFVLSLKTGEQIVIFVYPLVHKQDNTKNFFDTRDSGAYERGVAWRYALEHSLMLLCSYNRLIANGKGFVSFGDSNGRRNDFYRKRCLQSTECSVFSSAKKRFGFT